MGGYCRLRAGWYDDGAFTFPACGAFMRHDWIFDVLTDLRSYALKNGLPALAAQVEDAMELARAEIAAQEATDKLLKGDGSGGMPPSGRPH